MKYYALQDEASEEVYEFVDNKTEAIEDAKRRSGHMLVVDCDTEEVVFDTMPNVSHKF